MSTNTLKLNATVNLDLYIKRLQEKIGGYMTNLTCIILSLEDTSYQEKAAAKNSTQPHLAFASPLTSHKGAAERQIDSCFSDMIDSFLTFMDEMFAIEKFTTLPIDIAQGLAGKEEIEKYAETMLQEVINNVRQDSSLKAPGKIKSFNLTTEYHRMITQLVELRNCLTHHDKIAKKGLTLEIKQANYLVAGKGMPSLQSALQPGQSTDIKIDELKRFFPKGSRVSFTEYECQSVGLTIMALLAPVITDSMKRRIAINH